MRHFTSTASRILGILTFVLLIMLSMSPHAGAAPVTIQIGSLANDVAWDYQAGGQQHGGDMSGTIPLGNINSTETRVRAFIKFDITAFAGKTLENATLNLPRETVYGVVGGTHNVSVDMVDYDAGAGPFASSPALIGLSVTAGTTYNVSNPAANYAVNITSAVQTAIQRGYSYVTFRIKDNTIDASSASPYMLLLNTGPSLTLTEAPSISLGDTNTNIAWDYAGGTQFHTGLWEGIIPVGNINPTPTHTRAFIKFPISEFLGRILSGATFTLPRYTSWNIVPSTITHILAVDLVDYDAGATAFSNSPPLIERTITSGPTFGVTNSVGTYRVDVTSIVQTAISRGYQYVTFRIRDLTVEAGSDWPAHVFFAGTPTLALAEQSLSLVENGVGRVSIHNIGSGAPLAIEQYAAQQLQAAFTTATGVTPPINPTTASAVQIKLGLASDFTTPVGTTNEQAYRYWRAADGHIEVIGNSPGALMWAVGDFCRNVLNISWPVANGQIARIGADRPTLRIDKVDVLNWPDFTRRGWTIGDNTDGYGYNDLIGNWMAHTGGNVNIVPMSQVDNAQAKRLARGIEPDTSMHSFSWLIPPNEFGTCHPEYFPLIGGNRVVSTDPNSTNVQLCLSNPDVLSTTVEKAQIWLDIYPEVAVFGVSPNDGPDGWCQCANCEAWDGDQAGQGKYSNRLIHFCNLVAQGIATSHPDRMIGTLAYARAVDPPTIAVHPKVAITFATGGRNFMKKLTDPTDSVNAMIMNRLNGWLAKSSHIQLWEYYYYTGIERIAVPWTRTLCTEFVELHAAGLEGIVAETVPKFWSGMSLFSYAFSRLSWDSTLTYDDIMADFCNERYGPAAAYMYLFHRLYEDTIYANVPSMPALGPGEQLISPTFTNTQLATLDSYLTSAASIASSTGTTYHQSQVAAERSLFDSMLALRIDPATTPGIGPNLINDSGAELYPSDDGPWDIDVQSGNYSFDRPTSGAHSGTQSLRIHSTGASGWSRWHQAVSGFVVGKKYTVRIWVKATSGASGQIWMINNDHAHHVTLNFIDTGNQWVMLVVPEFTATHAGGIFYMNSFGTGDVYFDDIFIAQLPD